MTYLSDEENKKFEGDGSKNSKGQDLKTFLEAYDPKAYNDPCNTVDMAVFGYEGALSDEGSRAGVKIKNILLVKRGDHPSIGEWAIPGGFVEYREDLDEAARRELEEETDIKGIIPVQVATHADPGRDPRARLITTLYTAMVPAVSLRPTAGDDASEARLFNIKVELINTEREDREGTAFKEVKRYAISLICDETGEELSGQALSIEESDGLVSAHKYKKISSRGIAMDHCNLILDAYLFIKSLLVN